MTTVAIALPVHHRHARLLPLAVIEAKRFASHPFFLVGFGLAVAAVIADRRNSGEDALDFQVMPAFFIGVVGLIVAARLTRSTRGATDVMDGAPVSVTMRSAALCLACVVPVMAGMVVVLVHWRVLQAYPAQQGMWGTYGTRDRVLLNGVLPVLYCAGGPLLGVAIGRWLRFPGATLLVVAALLLGSLTLTYLPMQSMDASSLLARVLHLLPPYTSWGASNNDRAWVSYTGSMPFYALWVSALSGLAAVAALRHGSTGLSRRVLGHVFLGLMAAGLVALSLAVAGGHSQPMITQPDGSSTVATPAQRVSQ